MTPKIGFEHIAAAASISGLNVSATKKPPEGGSVISL
jgi:hypothetical protein